MTVQRKINFHPYVINYFRELLFYDIYIEHPKIKRFKNIDLLSELLFYEELNVIKTDNTFKGCAMSCKVKLVEEKWSIIQLEASKSSIKDLFNDLLDETKSFESQINAKILLKKTKALKPFQEILYRIVNWINEKFGWIIESIVSQYIKISTLQPLIGSSYIKVLAEIRSSK